MESLIDILQGYGYAGMFVASFLAGSVFPFSSEAVMAALTLMDLNIWILVAYSTLGNVLGGMFNYFVGRLGNDKWVYKLFRVKEDRMEKAQTLVHRYGSWMGLLSWVPILGSVITISLGLLHINVGKAFLSTFIGKFLRYVVLAVILEMFE